MLHPLFKFRKDLFLQMEDDWKAGVLDRNLMS